MRLSFAQRSQSTIGLLESNQTVGDCHVQIHLMAVLDSVLSSLTCGDSTHTIFVCSTLLHDPQKLICNLVLPSPALSAISIKTNIGLTLHYRYLTGRSSKKQGKRAQSKTETDCKKFFKGSSSFGV